MPNNVTPANVPVDPPVPIIVDDGTESLKAGRRACIYAFELLLNAMNLLNAAAAGLEGYLVQQQMNNTKAQQAQLKIDMDAINNCPKGEDYASRLSILVKKYDMDSQLYNAANTTLGTPVDLIQKLVSTVPQLAQQMIGQMQTLVQQGGFLADRLR
jgi:hypothetical protein